jgi:hypothetical protein
VRGKLLPWLALALPGPAWGAAYDVEARTEAQAYTIGAFSPDSGRTFQRRRLVQDLDLAGFELVAGQDAGLSLHLRVDADFAVRSAELGNVDGLERDRLQLLVGRLHWNGLLGGVLDVEAGRVTARDAIGFWRYDGGRATVRPVSWLAVTAFGGWRVTGSSWIASSTFAPDGTRDADRRRIAGGAPLFPSCPGAPNPTFLTCADETLDDRAPTFGARLALLHVPGGGTGGAEVEYRRTLRAGSVIEERLGAGAR